MRLVQPGMHFVDRITSPTRMRLTTCFAALVLMIAPAYGRAQSADDAPALPATIPLFPLPDVALLPNITLPLHIFEPRYRRMVADALDGDRLIGMVMLRPGYEAEYEGRPPVYDIGGAGRIESAERLPDGRYVIVLRGITRFRIVGEDDSRPYRIAFVDPIPDVLPSEDRELLGEQRRHLEELVMSVAPNAQPPAADLSDEDVINIFTQFLPLEPTDRQILLEEDGAVPRSKVLIGLLEAMRSMRRTD